MNEQPRPHGSQESLRNGPHRETLGQQEQIRLVDEDGSGGRWGAEKRGLQGEGWEVVTVELGFLQTSSARKQISIFRFRAPRSKNSHRPGKSCVL